MLFFNTMLVVIGIYLILIGVLALRLSRRDRLKIKRKVTYGKNVTFKLNDVDVLSFHGKLIK